MSNSREDFLKRVKGAVAGTIEKVALPQIDPSMLAAAPRLVGASSWDAFRRNIEQAGGVFIDGVPALIELLRREKATHGVVDPQLMTLSRALQKESFVIESAFDRKREGTYAFGITTACGVIAETGSIVLNDATSFDRLAALAPWIHVACVKRDQIYRTVSDAIAAFGHDPNIVWVTGPSKTADVEGIFIHGVHGPGIQSCMVLP